MKNYNKEKMQKSSLVVMNDVFKMQKGDKVLIITNPSDDVLEISKSLYQAVNQLGGKPNIVIQNEKTLFDYCDEVTVNAFKTEPKIALSISANKLGKDEKAIMNPYVAEDGTKYDHIFHYLEYGKKNLRAVWTPGITIDMFLRTVDIDYKLLKKRCETLMGCLEGAESVHVTSKNGTDVLVSIVDRLPFADDGDFSTPSAGGNIPAGEVFISPVVGKTQGVIVYDGSITLHDRDIIIYNPIKVTVDNGYVSKIESLNPKTDANEKSEAELLLDTITQAEIRAIQMEKDGKLPKGMGESYKKNARNIGELGIGLNPNAKITGNMLEDEKAFNTCHFAIGSNYDNDADSLIHLDGLVKNPTIVVNYADGSSCVIEKDGKLLE